MSRRNPIEIQADWKRELRRTDSCIAVERFAGDLTSIEREHLARCARCEAELALWSEFHNADSATDDGAAIQWIAAETRRRLQGPSRPEPRFAGWRAWFQAPSSRGLAMAATVMVVVALGYFATVGNPPSIRLPGPGPETYRSASVELLAPSGDVGAPPTELRWAPVAGAARYEVEVREVDGTVVWRVSITDTRAALPAAISAQFAPHRSFLWQVIARGSNGTQLAASETARFRVVASGR